MTNFPAIPVEHAAPRSAGAMPTRFEDIAQDGRVLPEALAHAIGASVWVPSLSAHPGMNALIASGTVPVLSRLLIEGDDATLAAGAVMEATGTWAVAHTRGADGAVDRVMLLIEAEVTGRVGRTYFPPPEDAGRARRVGRVFAEHVFTRPFAPAGARKVTALDADGLPSGEALPWPWTGVDAVRALPADAVPLGSPSTTPEPLRFGLVHTDSNQHVNSLVYPRRFEERALAHLAALGVDASTLLARRVEAAFRKPCFAGDVAWITLRAWTLHGALWVSGTFHPEDPAAPPFNALRLRFG